jgi:hypothetical protein
MQDILFKNWLTDIYGMEAKAAESRTTNCRTIEKIEGDLDMHFEHDKGKYLLELLTYSRADEANNAPAKYNIPIDGVIYTGTSTLKQAINRYMEFKQYQAEQKKSDSTD